MVSIAKVGFQRVRTDRSVIGSPERVDRTGQYTSEIRGLLLDLSRVACTQYQYEAVLPLHHQAGIEWVVCGMGRGDPWRHHTRPLAGRVPREPSGRATAYGSDTSRRGAPGTRRRLH